MTELRVQTGSGVIVDEVRESPVDRKLYRFRNLLGWIVLIVIVLLAIWFYLTFMSDRPRRYADIQEHFKYGSIGSEPGGSLLDAQGGLLPPYEIFRILPMIAPEKLPGGYASLGLTFEPGHDLPIGISRRYRLGFDQVGVNCAFCHTGTWRETPAGPRHIVLGMPANRLQIERLFRFILAATLDERFTPDNVIGLIKRSGGRMTLADRILYRTQMVFRVREATLQMQDRMGILLGDAVTEWGPGRVDTFNPYKALQFHWPLDRLPHDELIGASDYPSLWNQSPREGMQLHWDGNNTSLAERNLSAALGAGVTPVTADHASIERVAAWAKTLPPPKYPFMVDANLAARGQQVYAAEHCYECHGDHRFRDGIVVGSRLGKVTPLDAVRTDEHRLNSYTSIFAENQYTLYPSSKYRFTHFRKTGGYSNQPLDGLWARAPYLHNGSVPTLRDLLEPPAARPAKFYKGYDVYDQKKVGFVYDVPAEGTTTHFLFDTSLPGNSSGGHLWGTTLSAQDKDALVEYLKTF